MNKIYLLLMSMICTPATAFNQECVHATLESAIKESASLEEYQTAWNDISTIYLASNPDLTPLIKHSIHTAQAYRYELDQKITDTACPVYLTPDKLKIACGVGKVATGAYLIVGLVVLTLSRAGSVTAEKAMKFFFPIPSGVQGILNWLLTHTKYASISMETSKKIGLGLSYAQGVIALPLAPYLLYTGLGKIQEGINYTDTLMKKRATLDLIIAYMQMQQ
jgi:hypothetical protein